MDHRWWKLPFQSSSAPAGLSGGVNQMNLVSAAETIVMLQLLVESTKLGAKSQTVWDLLILYLNK